MTNEIRPTDQPASRPVPQSLRPPSVKSSRKDGGTNKPEADIFSDLRSRLVAANHEMENLQSGLSRLHTRGRQLDQSLAQLRQAAAPADAPAPEAIATLIGTAGDKAPTVQQATERITELRARVDEDLGSTQRSILKGQVALQNLVSADGGGDNGIPAIPPTPPSHELNGSNVLRLLEENP